MVKNKEEDLWKTTHKEEDNGLKQQASKQASKQASSSSRNVLVA
jgi:hypothetical protein